MINKAKKHLEEMETQAAHLNEQLLMTRGAIQILQVLIAESEDNTDDEKIQSQERN